MKDAKVFVTQEIPSAGIDLLKKHTQAIIGKKGVVLPRDKFLKKAKPCQALLTMMPDKIDGEVMDALPELKIIANYAVGYDNIDVKAAAERKIYVSNTPDVLAETTADLAWALLMAAARRVVEGDKITRAGKWGDWRADFLLGQDIHHATLGIIGMGSIGSEVAKRSTGFSMKVLYHNRHRNKEAEKKYGAKYVDLETLLKESDFISLNCPLTNETRGLINTKTFSLMKKNAIIVNTARGPVIDQKALYKALKTKRIAAAGLDVYEKEPLPLTDPLHTLDNVVLSPHVGSASVLTRNKMSLMAAQNIMAVLNGKKPINWVNPF